MKLILSLIFFLSFRLQAEVIKDFKLPIFDQQKIFSIQDQRGKIVVINFWASWCIACIQEMPELNLLKDKFANAAVFIAINAGDTPVQIKKLLRKHKFDFLILEDSTREVSKSLGVYELPRTIIVSAKGEIIYNASRPPKNIN